MTWKIGKGIYIKQKLQINTLRKGYGQILIMG